MGRNREGLIIYKYEVKFEVFNDVGDRIDRGSKLFEKLSEAEEYAQKVKQRVDVKTQVFVDIINLDTNQLVNRYKKKSGNVNYSRKSKKNFEVWFEFNKTGTYYFGTIKEAIDFANKHYKNKPIIYHLARDEIVMEHSKNKRRIDG